MIQSDSKVPDLDWSQVRETVKLLTASIAQVEKTMSEGDKSVNSLTESFTTMVQHMNAINGIIVELEPSEKRDIAIEQCKVSSEQIQSSIVAFQFYDRLQQSLSHVVESLKGLSNLVGSPERLFNPLEWKKFQNEIRSRFTMESEKAIFDAILQGKSIEEAIQLASKADETNEDTDDIELF